ncbi:hypothetical protein [Plantibacter sp. CFBP 8804]|uniref:hypothetical protein n=1 Tax=Plantibacter sp. CFBP 8804 TaxID=2775270 RepID=UPI00177C49F6|nr:hypothetical protein [Plantibacter sp. CFBP 8804]MBD8515824.1 hypothetical protein [Plantibacter sp. CFBP 8804]
MSTTTARRVAERIARELGGGTVVASARRPAPGEPSDAEIDRLAAASFAAVMRWRSIIRARAILDEAARYQSASASLNRRASRPVSTPTKPRNGRQPAARSRARRNAGVTS